MHRDVQALGTAAAALLLRLIDSDGDVEGIAGPRAVLQPRGTTGRPPRP
jgi:hypothetical protein